MHPVPQRWELSYTVGLESEALEAYCVPLPCLHPGAAFLACRSPELAGSVQETGGERRGWGGS